MDNQVQAEQAKSVLEQIAFLEDVYAEELMHQSNPQDLTVIWERIKALRKGVK